MHMMQTFSRNSHEITVQRDPLNTLFLYFFALLQDSMGAGNIERPLLKLRLNLSGHFSHTSISFLPFVEALAGTSSFCQAALSRIHVLGP